MTPDPASFRDGNLIAVYGTYRVCAQTVKGGTFDDPVEVHHILGRGGKGDRRPYSSVFNAIQLKQSIHHGPLRDAPDQRRVYLRVARDHVMNAAGQGRYELNEIDRRFVELIREEYPEYADLYDSFPTNLP